MCVNPVFTVYIPFHRGNEVSAESSILFQTINTTNALRRAMAYKVTCSLPSQVICSVCSESSERYKSVLSEFEISASETCFVMKLTHRVSSSTSSRCCGCRVSFTQLQLRWVSVQTSQGCLSSCYSKQESAQQRGVRSQTTSASAGLIHRQPNCTKVPRRASQ